MTPEEKQQFLNSGLLDGIKTQEDLSSMLKELHSTALEAMLQGEMDSHLSYSKHEQSVNTNARNGSSSKRVKTDLVKAEYKCPETVKAVLSLLPCRSTKVLPHP